MALCGRNKYILEFTTSGDYFPMRYDDSFDINGSSTDNIGRVAGFKFNSNTDQKITYDLNDGGEPIVVENIGGQILGVVHYKPETDLSNNVQGRFYQDGNSGDRIIRITFEQPLEITYFFIGYTRLKGDLPKNLGNFINMTSWSIRYIKDGGLVNIPKEVLNMRNLVNPAFVSAFNSTAPFFKIYPIEFLNTRISSIIVNITYQGVYANSSDVVSLNNNWDKFHLLNQTLMAIEVSQTNIGNGDIKPSIIDSWVQCNNLRRLTINSNRTTKPYNQLNRLTQLTFLNIGGGSDYDTTMNDWGDLSNLVNLEEFNGGTSYNTPTTMPNYWLQMPKLRKILLDWNYTTQERWDEAIENLYNFVVDNTPIVNDDVNNPIPMRNQEISMTANAYSGIGINEEYVIQGTYQQPTGYEQGVSNGTPVSQLEKIWVLEHQYNVSVSYTDNR